MANLFPEFYMSRGYATDYGSGSDISRYHGTSPDNRTIRDSDARQYDRTHADPDIVADHNGRMGTSRFAYP
jgi:hypothetical protein